MSLRVAPQCRGALLSERNGESFLGAQRSNLLPGERGDCVVGLAASSQRHDLMSLMSLRAERSNLLPGERGDCFVGLAASSQRHDLMSLMSLRAQRSNLLHSVQQIGQPGSLGKPGSQRGQRPVVAAQDISGPDTRQTDGERVDYHKKVVQSQAEGGHQPGGFIPGCNNLLGFFHATSQLKRDHPLRRSGCK